MKNYSILLFAIILLASCSKNKDLICTAENETGQFITSNTFSSDLDGVETIWNFSPNGTLRTYPPGTDKETYINIYEWEWLECDVLRITLVGHQFDTNVIYSIPDYYYIIDLHFASYENEVISATYNPLKPGVKSTFFNLIKK